MSYGHAKQSSRFNQSFMSESFTSSYDWTNPKEALSKIKSNIINAMSKEEKWYSNMRVVHALSTRFIRFLSIVLFAFGSIYPICSKGEDLEWGYICLAVGSLLLIMDKFFGISSSFVRFYLAEIEIRRHTHEFAENWEKEIVKVGSNFSQDNILNLLNVAQKFREAVSNTILSETTAWSTEFQAQIGELNELLKVKVNQYKYGNISVTVNNTKLYESIILTLDDNVNSKIILKGRTTAIFRNVSIGPHQINVEAVKEPKKDSKPEIFSQNTEVTGDKTAEVILALP